MLPPIFGQESQPALLWNQPISSWFTPTGLSPSMAPLSRGFRFHLEEKQLVQNPTSVPSHDSTFGLPCSPFARRYSGNPYWFLFLRVLRCFNSPRSPSHAGVYSDSHSGILGSKTACVYPRLIAACHALLRRLSRAIHPAASSPHFLCTTLTSMEYASCLHIEISLSMHI